MRVICATTVILLVLVTASVESAQRRRESRAAAARRQQLARRAAAQRAAAKRANTQSKKTNTDASASGFESRFGRDLPPLRQCLEFSKKTGLWGGDRVGLGRTPCEVDYRFKFAKDGAFSCTLLLFQEWENKFARKMSRTVRISQSGTWSLNHREFNEFERKLFGISSKVTGKAYFLQLDYAPLKGIELDKMSKEHLDTFKYYRPYLFQSEKFSVQYVLDEVSLVDSITYQGTLFHTTKTKKTYSTDASTMVWRVVRVTDAKGKSVTKAPPPMTSREKLENPLGIVFEIWVHKN